MVFWTWGQVSFAIGTTCYRRRNPYPLWTKIGTRAHFRYYALAKAQVGGFQRYYSLRHQIRDDDERAHKRGSRGRTWSACSRECRRIGSATGQDCMRQSRGLLHQEARWNDVPTGKDHHYCHLL
jgi:hypothetical protein